MLSDYRGRRVLIGPPGTGKSRFLADRVERIVNLSGSRPDEERSPVLVCSLTRAAAAELGSRVGLPDGAKRTIHSLAYRSMDPRPTVIDAEITRDEWNENHPAFALTPPGKGASHLDDVFAPFEGSMPGDAVYAEYQILRQRCAPRAEWPDHVHAFARPWEGWKRQSDLIDFCDMLEFAGEAPPLDPEVIIVDEAQDCSRLAWNLILRWSDLAGGLIVAGDPYQSLYDPWAGADASALFDLIRDGADSGVLKQSWRVPEGVHARAMRWIRQLSKYQPIDYFPRRIDSNDPSSPFVPGGVKRCPADWREPYAAIQEAEELAAQGKSVLFIFLTNRMTAPICREMRARTLPFDNPWRRKEVLWNPIDPEIMGGIGAFLDPAARWTWRGVARWVRPLRAAGLLQRGAKSVLDAVFDGGTPEQGGPGVSRSETLTREDQERIFAPAAAEELRQVCSSLPRERLLDWWRDHVLPSQRTAVDYCVRVQRKFGAKLRDVPVLLHPSTAHASKGGEADHVFFFPDFSTPAYDAWVGPRVQRDAVIRAVYVAMTRARECLHLCTAAGWRAASL